MLTTEPGIESSSARDSASFSSSMANEQGLLKNSLLRLPVTARAPARHRRTIFIIIVLPFELCGNPFNFVRLHMNYVPIMSNALPLLLLLYVLEPVEENNWFTFF